MSAGMGEYFEVDPTFVRIAWVLAAFLTCGTAILLYAACWFLMPPQERVYPYQ